MSSSCLPVFTPLLNMEAKVRQESYRASNLEQGSLEVQHCIACMYYYSLYDILSERTTHDKTKTTYEQINSNAAGILATLVTVGPITHEGKCVISNETS